MLHFEYITFCFTKRTTLLNFNEKHTSIFFLTWNFRPRQKHRTPLHYAAEKGRVSSIQVLIETNADIKAQDKYPIQKVTEIYNKVTEMYKKVTELEISSWNDLFLLRSEVAYIGTEPILP